MNLTTMFVKIQSLVCTVTQMSSSMQTIDIDDEAY